MPQHRELLYVIAEPEISDADRDWIQAIRKQHDPQFRLIGPHFTLLFGTDALPAEALISRVRAAASRVPPFAFDLRRVEVFPSSVADHYLFLIPEAGSYELMSLYETLNAGSVGDAAFVPHMTIGRAADAAKAKAIAEELNAAGRTVRGRVLTLKITAIAGRQARQLATMELKRN